MSQSKKRGSTSILTQKTVFSVIILFFIGSRSEAQGTQFFHGDQLGSAVVVTDENGDVQQVENYTPFGESFTPHPNPLPKGEREKGEGATAYLFTGQELDLESDLYSYSARYYDPALGRFLSTDPARDGLNLYAYARYNPLRYVDPDGRKPIFADKKTQQIVAWNAQFLPNPIMRVVLNEDVVYRTVELEIPLKGGAINLGESISGGFIPAEVRARFRMQRWEERFNKVPVLGKIPEAIFRLWFKIQGENPEVQVTPNITWDYLLHQISHVRLGDRYGEAGPFSLQLFYIATYYAVGKVAYKEGCQQDPACTRGWQEDMGRALEGMKQNYEAMGSEEFFGPETPQKVREGLGPFLKTWEGDKEKFQAFVLQIRDFSDDLLEKEFYREDFPEGLRNSE
jgi:RHS repeat-associated protein